MRRFDCFLYNGEADLAALRVEHLPGLEHVAVQSPETFQGTPQPVADTLAGVHLHTTDLPPGTTWEREAAQREAFRVALLDLGAGPDDIVLLSDVDEFPHPDVARHAQRFGVCEMLMLCYSPAMKHPAPWRGTVICRFGDIPSFQSMRDARWTAPVIPNAGWHLSWFGSAEDRDRKLRSFSHTELAGLDVESCAADGLHVDQVRLMPTSPDDLPGWLR